MRNITMNHSTLFGSNDDEKDREVFLDEIETLQSILNSLSEGVVVADMNGKFLFFNQTAQQILGIGLKDVSSTEWSAVYGCYYPDGVTPYPSEQLPLAKVLRHEEAPDQLIFIKNPERSEGAFIQISASPLKDKNDGTIGGTVIFRDVTENKNAEHEQKQSEDRIKAQFKGFPIPTYVWQKQADDFVLVDYNNAADIFTRGGVQEIMGQSFKKMYADSDDIQADFFQCYNEKRTLRREMPYFLKSIGQKKNLIVSYAYMPPDLVLVYTEDITQRKLAEEELQKLFNAVEQTADSVIITNKKGEIEYVNPGFEKTTGYARREVLGKKPHILKSGQHDAAFYENLWRIIRSGESYRGTIINKKKNGDLYWSQQSITPMKDPQGQITNFVSVLKDITELRQKQEQEFQLRIAREVQQRLYKTARVTVDGFDIAGASYSAVETSGDYYDFIRLPDGCLALIVGDVSGHGIGPAFIMAETRAYLRAFAKTESDPGILLTRLNNELVADLKSKYFVTLILLRLNPEKLWVDYASAGHVPVYVLDGAGAARHEMRSNGIPLGFIPETMFTTSQSYDLNSDDILVLLTDGINEARALDETEFGFDRALDVVKKHRKLSAKEIITQLFRATRDYAEDQPQEDDITSIICKALPPK